MAKTFTQYAEEAQMTEADRIAHRATWDSAIQAAAKVAESHFLAEQLARLTMSNPVTHSFNLCRAVANAISALANE